MNSNTFVRGNGSSWMCAKCQSIVIGRVNKFLLCKPVVCPKAVDPLSSNSPFKGWVPSCSFGLYARFSAALINDHCVLISCKTRWFLFTLLIALQPNWPVLGLASPPSSSTACSAVCSYLCSSNSDAFFAHCSLLLALRCNSACLKYFRTKFRKPDRSRPTSSSTQLLHDLSETCTSQRRGSITPASAKASDFLSNWWIMCSSIDGSPSKGSMQRVSHSCPIRCMRPIACWKSAGVQGISAITACVAAVRFTP
mmetsp:Transcript_111680/g.315864  ORF Transcript_111680/g.315864 Transcript_111680/m.315864 type:complete len:253 (-) Transcript_111680:312-1070(-)